MKLRVQKKPCATCIFRAECALDIERLVDAVRESAPLNWPKHKPWPFMRGHRVCHHSLTAVCAGFWALYKDKFQLGQIAQRLGLVEYVQDDTIDHKGELNVSNKHRLRGEARRARQRGQVPPRYAGISDDHMLAEIRRRKEAMWREAVDAANGRLEPKQYPLQLTEPQVLRDWRGGIKDTALVIVKRSALVSTTRGSFIPPTVVLSEVIEEPTLAEALGVAQAAGRTSMTLEELAAELAAELAKPVTPNWLNQKGFVRQGT